MTCIGDALPHISSFISRRSGDSVTNERETGRSHSKFTVCAITPNIRRPARENPDATRRLFLASYGKPPQSPGKYVCVRVCVGGWMCVVSHLRCLTSPPPLPLPPPLPPQLGQSRH